MLDIVADAICQSARMSEYDRLMGRLRRALASARARANALETLVVSFEKAKDSLSQSDLDALLNSMSPQFDSLFPETYGSQDAPSEAPQRVRGDLPPREVALLARDALLSVGRPLKRGQLVRELEKRNVPLAGADKNKNLGTIVWRHKELFVTLPKLGYWARGVALPGIYDPETFVDESE